MDRTELLRLLLEQHRQLREILAAIGSEAEVVARTGTPGTCTNLRALLSEMRRKLVLHTALERDAMVPLLENMFVWGRERLERLRTEHEAEHEALERSLELTVATVAPLALATAARELVAELLAHMDVEERDFLNATVLNEDVAKVDFIG